MKKIDFTKLGGFPLTQNAVDWLQSGYSDALKAIGELSGLTTPVIISGIIETAGVVSDGVLFFNGEFIPFTGGAVQPTIAISTYNTAVVYQDGSTYGTQSEKKVAFGTGAVQFNYSDLKTYQEGFGGRARSQWIDISPGIAPGTIYCYYNKMTGTVYVRGTALHSQFLQMGNPEMRQVASLPAEISTPNTVWFRTCLETHHLTEIRNANGDVYTGEVGRVNGTTIGISSRELAGGTPNPTHNFSFSYQL